MGQANRDVLLGKLFALIGLEGLIGKHDDLVGRLVCAYRFEEF